MRPQAKSWVYTIVFLLLFWTFILPYLGKAPVNHLNLSYSEFITHVEQGSVSSINIDQEQITGKLKSGFEFSTVAPVPLPDSTMQLLKSKNVKMTIAPVRRPSIWGSLLSMFLPILLLLALWIYMMRGAQNGQNQPMNFGKSRARRHDQGDKSKVTFADVAGAEEAKEELQEVIEFLKNPDKFRALGAKIPKGVLLVGPTGTGKTLLAKAVAGEAGVPFFSISGSEFVEMFVGVGASRVRDLFDQARKSAPCVIFVDEIDAVGRQRGAGLGGGHDEREQTLNQLLAEMDGFDPSIGIIMIAATNRPDILDPALVRPGRFDRRIVVDNADIKGRRAILEVHARGKVQFFAPNVNLDEIAKITSGFSGADLANVMNEAALLAARRSKKQIGQEELLEAIDRVIAGPQRKSRVLSPKVREMTAYHEGGHALLSKLIPESDPPRKITILPRAMALGYVIYSPEEDKFTHTQKELLARVTVGLGGRAAEEIIFGDITTGAQNDLEQITELARKMVTQFGMSEVLGPMTLGKKHGPIFLGRDIAETKDYSEETAQKIDGEIHKIIVGCYENAHSLLLQNRDKLARIAKALLEKETLDIVELNQVLAEPEVLPPALPAALDPPVSC